MIPKLSWNIAFYLAIFLGFYSIFTGKVLESLIFLNIGINGSYVYYITEKSKKNELNNSFSRSWKLIYTLLFILIMPPFIFSMLVLLSYFGINYIESHLHDVTPVIYCIFALFFTVEMYKYVKKIVN